MKIYIFAYAGAAVAFLIGDGLWLGLVARNFYRTQMGELLSASPNIAAAAAFYALYLVGVVYFAIAPALSSGSWLAALLGGALFGLIAYATYDLTALAVIRGFTTPLALVDMAWGAILTGFAATAGFFAARALA